MSLQWSFSVSWKMVYCTFPFRDFGLLVGLVAFGLMQGLYTELHLRLLYCIVWDRGSVRQSCACSVWTCNPLATAFQSSGITGLCYQGQLLFLFLNCLLFFFLALLLRTWSTGLISVQSKHCCLFPGFSEGVHWVNIILFTIKNDIYYILSFM